MPKNYRSYYGFDSKRKGKRSAYRSIRGRARFTRDTAKTIASKALLTARYVKSLLNVEFKHHDYSSSASISTTPSVNTISNIAQGDTVSTRDGDSVMAKSLSIRYTFTGNVDAQASYARLLLVKQKDNANSPTVAGGTDLSVLDGATMIDMRDLHNTGNFQILYDKVHSWSNNSNETYFNKFTIPFPNGFKLKYDAGGGRFNQLWLLIFSDQATNTPTLALKSRLRFIDN